MEEVSGGEEGRNGGGEWGEWVGGGGDNGGGEWGEEYEGEGGCERDWVKEGGGSGGKGGGERYWYSETQPVAECESIYI